MSDPPTCIVGAGRLGRALAARLRTSGTDPVVVSRRQSQIFGADGKVLDVADDPAAASGCGIVLLAVPASEVAAALRWLVPSLGRDTLVVNLATELPTTTLSVDGCRVVGCKIIGQSGQIERGNPAALVVDSADEADRALLARVLRPVGTVIATSEQFAARVNELVARRVIEAQLSLARALDDLGTPSVARAAAIGNLAPGIWDAVASGNTGPFLRGLVDEVWSATRARC